MLAAKLRPAPVQLCLRAGLRCGVCRALRLRRRRCKPCQWVVRIVRERRSIVIFRFRLRLRFCRCTRGAKIAGSLARLQRKLCAERRKVELQRRLTSCIRHSSAATRASAFFPDRALCRLHQRQIPQQLCRGLAFFPGPPPAPRPRCPESIGDATFGRRLQEPEDRGTAPTARQTARPDLFLPRHKCLEDGKRCRRVLLPCRHQKLCRALHTGKPQRLAHQLLRELSLYTQTRTDQVDSRHLASRRQQALPAAAAPQGAIWMPS